MIAAICYFTAFISLMNMGGKEKTVFMPVRALALRLSIRLSLNSTLGTNLLNCRGDSQEGSTPAPRPHS